MELEACTCLVYLVSSEMQDPFPYIPPVLKLKILKQYINGFPKGFTEYLLLFFLIHLEVSLLLTYFLMFPLLPYLI
jgi:hypothetical protein